MGKGQSKQRHLPRDEDLDNGTNVGEEIQLTEGGGGTHATKVQHKPVVACDGPWKGRWMVATTVTYTDETSSMSNENGGGDETGGGVGLMRTSEMTSNHFAAPRQNSSWILMEEEIEGEKDEDQEGGSSGSGGTVDSSPHHRPIKFASTTNNATVTLPQGDQRISNGVVQRCVALRPKDDQTVVALFAHYSDHRVIALLMSFYKALVLHRNIYPMHLPPPATPPVGSIGWLNRTEIRQDKRQDRLLDDLPQLLKHKWDYYAPVAELTASSLVAQANVRLISEVLLREPSTQSSSAPAASVINAKGEHLDLLEAVASDPMKSDLGTTTSPPLSSAQNGRRILLRTILNEDRTDLIKLLLHLHRGRGILPTWHLGLCKPEIIEKFVQRPSPGAVHYFLKESFRNGISVPPLDAKVTNWLVSELPWNPCGRELLPTLIDYYSSPETALDAASFFESATRCDIPPQMTNATLLQQAIARGNAGAVRCLIRKGSNIFPKTEAGKIDPSAQILVLASRYPIPAVKCDLLHSIVKTVEATHKPKHFHKLLAQEDDVGSLPVIVRWIQSEREIERMKRQKLKEVETKYSGIGGKNNAQKMLEEKASVLKDYDIAEEKKPSSVLIGTLVRLEQEEGVQITDSSGRRLLQLARSVV